MYMASITDKIELFINELMNNSNSIQIKRNELANLFNCAPSQINYVLMTRFTIDRGYYIDSKKGGGGYVQITKISSDKKKYIKSLIYERIGEEITYNAAKEVIKSLEKINILTERESKIILYSIEDKVLCIPISELKDKLRANILQNIVIGLLHIDERA